MSFRPLACVGGGGMGDFNSLGWPNFRGHFKLLRQLKTAYFQLDYYIQRELLWPASDLAPMTEKTRKPFQLVLIEYIVLWIAFVVMAISNWILDVGSERTASWSLNPKLTGGVSFVLNMYNIYLMCKAEIVIVFGIKCKISK